MNYDPSTAAILLVDPYNDFLSDGGKLLPRVKAVAGCCGDLSLLISRERARRCGNLTREDGASLPGNGAEVAMYT